MNQQQSTASASSERRICIRCEELNLEYLLGHPGGATAPPLLKRKNAGYSCPYYETPKMQRTRFEHENLRGLAILRRILSKTNVSLDHDCWACVKVKTWPFEFGVQASNYHLLNETEKTRDGTPKNEALWNLSRKMAFEMQERSPGVYPKYRSRLKLRDVPTINFGVPYQPDWKQDWLPSMNIVGPTIEYHLVGSWVRHCLQYHSDCGINDSVLVDELRNTRLFDVYERLLVPYEKVTPGRSGSPTFIALSYIWGGVSPTVERSADGRLKSLPLTLEHAILIVRNLGYRYVWIDSICIDQENKEEKLGQIDIMDVIYRSATATIILLDCPDAASGIPGVRSQTPDILPVLRVRRIDHIGAQIGSEEKMDVVSLHPPLAAEVWHSPWSKRAWTFQEGILSRRRIIVTRHQVFFSCETGQRSEDQVTNTFNDSRFPRPLVNPLNGLDENNDEECLKVYYEMVEDYVMRQMSNQDDSLKAVSAIFVAWERKTSRRQFLFGLPKWAFRFALVWTHNIPIGNIGDEFRPQRRNPDKFPSWSWCGWQLAKPPHWFPNVGKKIPPSHLEVAWNGQLLVSNFRNPQGNNWSRPPLEPESSALASEPIRILLDQLVSSGPGMAPDGPSSPSNCSLALKIYGILLRIRCTRTARGPKKTSAVGSNLSSELFIHVDPYILVGEGKVTYCDVLIVAIEVFPNGDRLSGIIIDWISDPKWPEARIATRVGSVWWSPREQSFLQDWNALDPRMETFWLV